MERKRVQLVCTDPSRTKQSFKDECDINKIMKRFKKVQGVEYLEQYRGYVGGNYGDFSQVVDYRSALDQVRRAQDVFGALPAAVRRRFGNDAAEFLDFVSNPANKDELVAMGLAEPKVQPKPVVAEQQEIK